MLGLRVECLIPARAFPMDEEIIAPVAGAVRRGGGAAPLNSRVVAGRYYYGFVMIPALNLKSCCK